MISSMIVPEYKKLATMTWLDDLAQVGGLSQPILADREHLQLEFRTGLSQGLLFYTGQLREGTSYFWDDGLLARI